MNTEAKIDPETADDSREALGLSMGDILAQAMQNERRQQAIQRALMILVWRAVGRGGVVTLTAADEENLLSHFAPGFPVLGVETLALGEMRLSVTSQEEADALMAAHAAQHANDAASQAPAGDTLQ